MGFACEGKKTVFERGWSYEECRALTSGEGDNVRKEEHAYFAKGPF